MSEFDISTLGEAEELGRSAEVASHAVHADPTVTPPEEGPLPAKLKKRPSSPAEWAYRRIILYISKFEETLDADHEAAMGFTNGGTGVMRIEGVGHFDPDILTFYGTDPAGGRVQLIQHVSQLSVMLRAIPKPRELDEPRRVGFRLASTLRAEGEGDSAEDAG